MGKRSLALPLPAPSQIYKDKAVRNLFSKRSIWDLILLGAGGGTPNPNQLLVPVKYSDAGSC